VGINIKKDDLVKVIAGNSKGKEGKVLKVLTKENKVMVEGINVVKKNQKPDQANPQGGIVKKTMPIAASNVMVVDPKSGEPTRIRRERTAGKPSQRVAVRNGNVID